MKSTTLVNLLVEWHEDGCVTIRGYVNYAGEDLFFRETLQNSDAAPHPVDLLLETADVIEDYTAARDLTLEQVESLVLRPQRWTPEEGYVEDGHATT